MNLQCTQTYGGIHLDCTTSIGGIKKVWIADYNKVKPTLNTESGDTTNGGMITDISGLTEFKQYQFRKETGSMTSTLTVDETAGINFVTTELNLVFTKMETAKRIEMSALAKGQLAVIVMDSNGKYWYLGYNDYVSSLAGGGNTGTAKTDQNAYTLTLKDESETYPYEVLNTVVESLE